MYQGDLDDIEMYFMATVKEIKKGIGSHYAEQEAMSKKVAEKMFTELTKGQDAVSYTHLELWVAEKFQSNPEIAGSPRNSFRTSLNLDIWR